MSEAVGEKGQALSSRVTGRSPIRAYRELVVGATGFGALLRYEFVAAWGSAIPGALGLAFRKFLWRRLFAQCGRGTVWGRGVVLRHPGRMTIGSGVIIDDNCYLDAKGCDAGEFRIGDDLLISRGCIISAKDGGVTLGARANIGANCVLYSSGGLEIGADTMLAANCYIGGGRYDPRGPTDIPMSEQPLPGRGVVIEDDCWLGAGVVVVDGVRIGRGSVVGAGAVVTRDVQAHSIVAGVPARRVDSRIPGIAPGRA